MATNASIDRPARQAAPAPPGWATGPALVAAYVAADWITYVFAIRPFAITPWNPHPGIAVAFLLLAGMRRWPWVVGAAIAADVLVRQAAGGLLPGVLGAVVQGAGYSVLALALKPALGTNPAFGTTRDVVRLFAVAVAVLLAVSAAYVGTVRLFGLGRAEDFAGHVAAAWIGDLLGVLVTTPLLLVIARVREYPAGGGRVSRRLVAAQAIATIAALASVFLVPAADSPKLFYVVFLPVLWIAATFGIVGSVTGNFLVQAGLIAGLHHAGSASADAFEFQFFMGALAVSALYLGAAVTERRRTEEANRTAQVELAHAMRLASNSQVASSLAHELNQPLAAMKTYVAACDLLLAQPAPDIAMLRSTIGKATRQAARAGEIVHGMREFFRAGSGTNRPVALAEMLDSASGVSRARFDRHLIAFVLSVPDAPVLVEVDRMQIETVLHNLIDNAVDAVKGGPEGRSIEVRARVDDGARVRVDVVDNGPGVAAEMIARLFQPRVSTKDDGMGLGLAISRSIIEAHGGRLWMDRHERRTCFSFTLPLVRGDEP